MKAKIRKKQSRRKLKSSKMPAGRRYNIYLSSDLHAAFKQKCEDESLSMSAELERMIEKFLAK